MSATLAALPAFTAGQATDRPARTTLAALLRASLDRRAGEAALADLPPRLRADVGLPPAPEVPRLRSAALIGW